jgi:hypothetical protein
MLPIVRLPLLTRVSDEHPMLQQQANLMHTALTELHI